MKVINENFQKIHEKFQNVYFNKIIQEWNFKLGEIQEDIRVVKDKIICCEEEVEKSEALEGFSHVFE